MKLTNRILVSLLLTGVFAIAAGSALANVAANTQIINEATLSYDDGTGIKTSTTSVTVTVSLVPASPLIIPLTDQTTAYNGNTTTLTNSFIVRTSANGPDSFDLTTAITGSTNTSGETATVSSAPSITLGASVTLTGSGTTAIIVPADGIAGTEVNGIEAGDTVYIDGETRNVLNVVDNATGTSTINLASALTNPPAAGLLVQEQKTITVAVTAGNISTPGTDVTIDKNLTATSTTSPFPTATSGTSITDTFTSGAANLTKYVRNIDVASGTGVPFVYGGNNYYQTGVNGEPNHTLEYILVATNTSGSPVNSAKVEDVLPTGFVTLEANAYGGGLEVTYVNDVGTPSTLSAAADGDTATFDGIDTLTVNVGTGATNLLGGQIPGSANVLVLYRVTINP